MAYDSKNLSCIGYANGFSLWHYRTVDPAEDVAAESYFGPAYRMVRVGDFVLVNAGQHGDLPKSSVRIVTTHGHNMVDGLPVGFVTTLSIAEG